MSWRVAVYEGDIAQPLRDTEYAISFEHGLNAFSIADGPGPVSSRGEILLRNRDGYWTDARAAALTSAEFYDPDDTLAFRAAISGYKPAYRDRSLSLELSSINAANYDKIVTVDLNAGNVARSDSAILGSSYANVAISNLSPWNGYLASRGLLYSAPLQTFLREFALFADAMIAEDRRGQFRAILPATENRSALWTLRPDDFYVHQRRAETYLRPGWRRDSIVSEILEPVYETRIATYPDDLAVSSRNVRRISNSGGVQTFEVEFDVLGFLRISQSEFGGFSHFTYENDTYILDRISGNNRGVSRNQMVSSRVSGGRPRVYVTVSIASTNTNLASDLELEDNFSITAYWFTADHNGRRVYRTANPRIFLDANAAVNRQTRPSAIKYDSHNDGLATARIRRLARYIPRVTRAEFPFHQRSAAALDRLVAVEVGDIIEVDFRENGFDFSTRNYVGKKRWRYEGGRGGTIELHLFSFVDVGRDHLRVFLGDANHPVFLGDANRPVYLEAS